MVRQRIGQRIAQARAANVEGKPAAFQRLADTARGRVLLVENDQDGVGHCGPRQESVVTI
jgi:hypothetical protein